MAEVAPAGGVSIEAPGYVFAAGQLRVTSGHGVRTCECPL